MDKHFEIIVLRDGLEPQTLGTMHEDTITYNRYNKGLLIAAGKLSNDNLLGNAFMKFETRFRNKAHIQFKGEEKTYFGDFCFINFIPETSVVVFGSVGPVIEMETAELDDGDDDTIEDTPNVPLTGETPNHVEPIGPI